MRLTARSIDILVAVLAVAFVIARRLNLLAPVTDWIVLPALAAYLVWFLRRRSPYRSRNAVL